jgi:hypothetical protein
VAFPHNISQVYVVLPQEIGKDFRSWGKCLESLENKAVHDIGKLDTARQWGDYPGMGPETPSEATAKQNKSERLIGRQSKGGEGDARRLESL